MPELADPGGMISVAAISEDQRAAAARYLTERGHADLLPMLGLTVEATGHQVVSCPTCGAVVGATCLASDRGKPMQRSHQARRLAAAAAGHEAAARAELDAEVGRG
jgi:hypothetical protein